MAPWYPLTPHQASRIIPPASNQRMNDPTSRARAAILPSNLTSATPDPVAEVHADSYERMLRELRSWGMWLSGLGVLNIVALGDAPWGVLLIAVGLSSWWFRSSAMFMVFATTLTWAGLSNLTDGASGHAVSAAFGLVQLYVAYRTVRNFRAFSTAHQALVATGLPDRAARVFPLGAAVLGVAGLAGLLGALILVGAKSIEPSAPAELLLGLDVDAGILGVALGVSSLLSGYRARALSIFGLASGGLAAALWLLGKLPGQ